MNGLVDIITTVENGPLKFMPVWLRQLVGLAAFTALAYPLLQAVIRRLIPWLAVVLVEPLAWIVDMLGRAALILDYLVARGLTRLGKPLPGVLYAYGDGVVTLANGTSSVIRRTLAGTKALRGIPKIVVVLVLVAGFVEWNSSHCSATVHGTCVSPVTQWTNNLSAWQKDRQAAHK